MTNDNITTKEAFDQTGQAIFRGIAEVAKLHPIVATNEPAKAFISVFFPVVGLSVSRMAQRFFADRLPRLSDGYAKAFGEDENKVAEHARQHEDNGDFHEIMFRTFRAMTDAIAPEVVPTLGLLAGQYTFGGKKADHYFRTLGRLLCDLEVGDLEDLKTLLRGVAACQGEGDLGTDNVPDVGVRLAQTGSVEVLQGQTSKDGFCTMGTAPAARRLFFLLKREGLGSGVGGGFMRQWNTLQSNDSTIMMDFVKSRRMMATIDPTTAGR